jgi:hypothetical protein
LTPISHQHRQGEGFVDNVTLWNASYYNTCIVALVSQAAYKAQVWAQLVFICGRWLNLLKCYWFAVSWQFKPTGEAIMETITNNPHLKISITQQ